jgi:ankyrin repeat domain-containing protein 50
MKHVQRFKARILGRSESPPKPTLENSCPRLDESSSSVTEPTKSRTTTHGLFILADSKPDESGLMDFPVDIVAIHGLNGNAISTWRHEPDGTVWLRDLLPNFLPGCRVYTYGYPSKIWSQSSERVQEYALNLLVSLRDVREDLNAVIYLIRSFSSSLTPFLEQTIYHICVP